MLIDANTRQPVNVRLAFDDGKVEAVAKATGKVLEIVPDNVMEYVIKVINKQIKCNRECKLPYCCG